MSLRFFVVELAKVDNTHLNRRGLVLDWVLVDRVEYDRYSNLAQGRKPQSRKGIKFCDA